MNLSWRNQPLPLVNSAPAFFTRFLFAFSPSFVPRSKAIFSQYFLIFLFLSFMIIPPLRVMALEMISRAGALKLFGFSEGAFFTEFPAGANLPLGACTVAGPNLEIPPAEKEQKTPLIHCENQISLVPDIRPGCNYNLLPVIFLDHFGLYLVNVDKFLFVHDSCSFLYCGLLKNDLIHPFK